MLARYTHPTSARKQRPLETSGNELLGQEMGSATSQPDKPDTKQ
jgi:hypothetical protein